MDGLLTVLITALAFGLVVSRNGPRVRPARLALRRALTRSELRERAAFLRGPRR